MKSYYLILLNILFIYLNQAYSQQYAVDLIPKSLKSRATAIVREENTLLDMKNESSISQTVHRVITILNQSGNRHAELMLFYDKSKSIKDVKGLVYDEFGQQIKKFNSKDFKDYSANDQVSMFDDIRVKHYSPNVNSYPYTIAYTYEIKHNQNLFIPYWQPDNSPDLAIEKSSYTFACNPDLALRIKEQNLQQKVQLESNEKVKTYNWTVNNINARKEEIYSPIERSETTIVKIVPESFQYFKKNGTVNNWNDLGKWIYEDLLKDKQDLPQTSKDKVKQLTNTISDPKEKAKILYEYMQQKTRYISIQVGIGGLEPFPASYVDRLGYGDCKALVNYMQALLHEAGIASLYCVVEAGRSKVNLDEDFANAVDGNHIILCIPFEKDSVWLECTSNKHPFGYLGDFTDDRLVLACSPEGGKILKTQSYNNESNLQHRKAILNINKEGSVSGKIITTFAGTQFDNHYSNMFKNPSEQNKELKTYYDIDNISFNSTDYKISNYKLPELSEYLDIDIKNYVVKNGNQFVFQPNIFNLSRPIPESKSRINKVHINRGYTDIDEIEYVFESKFAGKIQPLNKDIDCPIGTYSLEISNKDDKINFKRTFQINEGVFPVEDYEKFYTFMREVAASDHVIYTLNLQEN